eukprot:2301742-Amphidinium_carterae.3
MDKEYNKHKNHTWDETKVKEFDGVVKEAKAKGETFHGNAVRDQDGNWAIFRELGASPASMEAPKFVDFIGMLPGNTIMQFDAEMVYVQATLKGCAA